MCCTAELHHCVDKPSSKRFASVRNNNGRGTVPENNVVNKKLGNLECSSSLEGFCFGIPSEVVGSDYNSLVSRGRRRKWSQQVHPDLFKRLLGDLDRVQEARWPEWWRFPSLTFTARAHVMPHGCRKFWPVV